MTAFFDLPVRRHEANGIHIAARVDGSGPPLLLLHGHPQTHAIWHRVWPELTRRHTCVAADLRGYGDSDKPAATPDHAAHSKRAMAADMVALMRALGHERFDILAHDRGARVAHRLGLDHAEAVGRMMLLDIAPTLDMYENTTRAFAQAYYHWFWLIQPAPMPETMIERDPVFYLRSVMGGRPGGLAHFSDEAMAEYERTARLPGWATGICEDYRASATLDLEHDRQGRAAGERLRMPLRVLWGERGAVGRNFDVLGLWRAVADEVDGGPLPGAHYLAEETPDALLREVASFFGWDGRE
ncbi:alpha/beta hydrolase [Achromobacter xylosoxidans]|uniref:alpha/beta fold hydrolase n=1 Tax=Alcaligenes xylosoxydans xylosoxydans TaxID=85698 RepID=UPI00064DE9BB|nr:alpha/beta hydrolase [Achromobacter xylosoxidans]KAA5922516.1 alpha/beta hydrolase [Achromobacter xylosoxidans]KMJ88365.1 alpha/beta hydrolase [Achromobacter xylosoxidans]QKI70351.1 alpha/beta hydrolase [Achromobacter xylosoxidans]WOB73668.1 alpha/beta hydrolase [Achromobacter xylosoxidans]